MVAFVSNLSAIKHSIDMAKAKIEHTVTAQIQGVVAMMLKDLAMNTPQWSGDLAASWQVVVGKGATPSNNGYTGFKATGRYVYPPPHFKGDPDAIGFALMANMADIASIRWNSNISIVNNSQTLTVGKDGPPLTSQAQLRDGNFISGDFMAVKYVAQKYRDKNMKNTRFGYFNADQITGM